VSRFTRKGLRSSSRCSGSCGIGASIEHIGSLAAALAAGTYSSAAWSENVLHNGFGQGPTGPLNDTGIQFCGGAISGNGTCTGSSPQGQDAFYGRDALAASGQLIKIGGRNAGFDSSVVARGLTIHRMKDPPLGDGQCAAGLRARWPCGR